MKEIKRYNLEVTSMHCAYGCMEESDEGDYVEYSDVEQLQARIKELEVTIKLHEQLAVSNEYEIKKQSGRLENYYPLLKRVDSTEMIVHFLISAINNQINNGTPPTKHYLIQLIQSIIQGCNKSSMVDKDNYMFIELQQKLEQLKN